MAKKKIVPVEIVDENKPKGMLEKIGIVNPIDLSSQIRRDFLTSEQTKYTWIPERNEDVKNYFGVIKASEWPFKGASQIKSQFQRIVVDTFAGNVIKSLFLPEHPIAAYPAPIGEKTSENALSNIKYVEDLHNSIQKNEYKLKQVLDKAIPTALIESFVVLHPAYEYLTNEVIVSVKRWVPKDVDVNNLTYDLDTDTVNTKDGQFVPSVDLDKKYMSEDELKTTGMVEVQFDVVKEECVKDGISIKTINGYRFYIPIGTPGETPFEKVQRAPYCVHQLYYTIKEVMQYSELGYFEDVAPVIQSANTRYEKEHGDSKGKKPIIPATVYDRQRELITYTKVQQAGYLFDVARLEYEYVEVLKWCGKWKIDGKWQELIVWMDNGSGTILRVEKNVYGVRPYFPIVPFPVDETPYGESLCKIIRPLVKELDLLMRIVTNIALMKSAPPKFYDPASGFNPSTIGAFGPNSWIPAREPARNVLIPPQPEDPQISMQMIQLLINIIERITGINEVVQGQISNRANTTAFEVNTAMVRSGVRFDQVYDRIKEQLNPMFKFIHKLMLRHMPETKEIRLMGTENKGRLVAIHKEQMAGAYEFELSGNSVVTEQNELQNAMALFQTIGQHPYVTYKPESIYYILYNIVKRLNPVAMDKILPKPEEVAKLERDRQQVQLEQEQQAVQQQQQQQSPQIAQAQQQMQLQQAEVQQKLQQNDAVHKQKLTHAEQKHNQDMLMMKMKADAQAQQAEIQLAQMKARAHAEAKDTKETTPNG